MRITISPEVVSKFMTPSRRGESRLTDEEGRLFASYLVNPVATGLWRLTARWTRSGIVGEIWEELDRETKGRDSLTIASGKRDRRFRIDSEWRGKLKQNVTETLSFPMSLFEHFATADDSDGEEGLKFGAAHEQVQLVLDIIDASTIRTKYEEAVSLFRDRIQCSDFKAVVAEGEAARTRTGLFIVECSPRESGVVSILALQRNPLQDLSEFFSAAGIVADPCLLPIFSPEEEIFAPYFNFLKIASGAVILQRHLRPLVLKAIRNVEEENFTDCVAAIGLGAEDVLTQIFESLYRAQLIRGLTIGQLADEIGARARSTTKRPSPTEPELENLYDEIKSAMADEALSTKRCVELTRTMLTRLIELQKYNRQQLQQLKQPDRKVSVWPPAIEYAVEELIRYRNAAAHKSRIPIGHTECRRAMHSLVMLHSWWEGEKRAIDWGLSPEEIVSRCVARASAG